ncbi:MAG: ABC transporter permease subunit, partial [Clostridia bacterium]
MEKVINNKPSSFKRNLNKGVAYFTKAQNIILLVLGIALTIATLAPIFSIFIDTITIHVGSIDQYLSGKAEGLTIVNWVDLFTGQLKEKNLITPMWNTLLLSAFSCLFALMFGGTVAYLVTRTNLKFKKYISAIFIFPYIMPQWTLAMVWKNLFNSSAVTGAADGILAGLFGINMPLWWCNGLFPSVIVLGMHYAPFAYILIGGIFRNMDANLEEAATILNTPKGKIFFRVTLPMVTPAVLSTILLVFSSAMGSYPVPHYLKLTTLSTKYVEMNVMRQGEASIIAVLMMIIGVAILMINQYSTSGRKQYTTVTGKSGQASLVNLGKIGKYVIAAVIVVITLFTSIYPIISFALETFLPNPGDYSGFTTKWWLTSNIGAENGMFGEMGILY